MFSFSNILLAGNNHFEEGKKLFELKKYKDSKFKFEKAIVFNPKSEKSYLYLAKIYNKNQNDEEEENNLNSVLLLNPKNEDAMHMLMNLKIKQSNYEETKNLLTKFKLICKSLCSKSDEINKKLQIFSSKDEKNNN